MWGLHQLNLFSHCMIIEYAHIGWMYIGHMSYAMGAILCNIMITEKRKEILEMNII